LDAEVASILGRSSGDEARELLLEGCYRPQGELDAVGALEHAQNLIEASRDARKQLTQALKDGSLQPAPRQDASAAALAAGLLDGEQVARLQAAEAARRRVIDVDDFSQDELKLSRGKVR